MLLLALVLAAAALVLGVKLHAARRRELSLEARLLEIERAGESSRRFARELLASLGHELRNPLGAILGYQELLVDGVYGPMGERGGEAAARIGFAARQLLHLIDAILDVARLEAGLAGPRTVPTALDAVVKRALVAVAGLAAERGTRFHDELPRPMPTLPTDPDRLCAAIECALDAAIRASPGETLVLRADRSDLRPVLEIAGAALPPQAAEGVSLPGPGPEADLGPSPAPGAAGAAGRRREDERIGLRLFLARRLLDLLGGRLEVEAAPADRTVLRLRLPAAGPPSH